MTRLRALRMFCNAKLLAIDSVKPGEILDKNFLLPAKPLLNTESQSTDVCSSSLTIQIVCVVLKHSSIMDCIWWNGLYTERGFDPLIVNGIWRWHGIKSFVRSNSFFFKIWIMKPLFVGYHVFSRACSIAKVTYFIHVNPQPVYWNKVGMEVLDLKNANTEYTVSMGYEWAHVVFPVLVSFRMEEIRKGSNPWPYFTSKGFPFAIL